MERLKKRDVEHKKAEEEKKKRDNEKDPTNEKANKDNPDSPGPWSSEPNATG